MKSIIYLLLTAALSFSSAGCTAEPPHTNNSGSAAAPAVESDAQRAPGETTVPEPENTSEPGNHFTLTVGGQSFTVTLEDSRTAQEFSGLLPMELDMSELNGNEKYFYLDTALTTDSYRPGNIQTGDLMLYGNNCVVLFYETFSSGYSYTRLGRVDNPEGLAAALGTGAVTVTFSMRE